MMYFLFNRQQAFDLCIWLTFITIFCFLVFRSVSYLHDQRTKMRPSGSSTLKNNVLAKTMLYLKCLLDNYLHLTFKTDLYLPPG